MALINQIRTCYYKLLPAHTLTLFLSVFMLTIAYQVIQQNHHGMFAAASGVFNDSFDVVPEAQNTASARHKHAVLPPIDRSENNRQSSQDTRLQAEQGDDESVSPATRRVQADISPADGSTPINRPPSQTTSAGVRAQNIYLPGATGGATTNNTVGTTSPVLVGSNATPSNNSTSSSSSGQPSAVTEPSQQSLLASNDINHRAQQLYEQRRQRLCQDVISRVGTNPLASDFNSAGEYYRLRDGYRCF